MPVSAFLTGSALPTTIFSGCWSRLDLSLTASLWIQFLRNQPAQIPTQSSGKSPPFSSAQTELQPGVTQHLPDALTSEYGRRSSAIEDEHVAGSAPPRRLDLWQRALCLFLFWSASGVQVPWSGARDLPGNGPLRSQFGSAGDWEGHLGQGSPSCGQRSWASGPHGGPSRPS